MPATSSSAPGQEQELTAPIRRSSLRVVAIGGGTGLSTLLRGLRRYAPSPQSSEPDADATPSLISDLAAVVTVTDDGGSSGRLRRHFNMLPPGDLRNCMVALADDEALLSRLFRHRFSASTAVAANGNGDNTASLEGHSFGNLFVAALAEITGDFAQAIKLSSQVLATRGHIYPATTKNVTLSARMDDGSLVEGETNITASKHRICELTLEPAGAEPLPETLDSIARADLVTLGPGSLYTSLITNLLVKGIPEALAEARGLRVFVCNLMTQSNESLNLTASQHIEKIYEHTGQAIFDYALVNTAPVSEALLRNYAREGAAPIVPDVERIEALGVRAIPGNFAAEGDVLRHNADRVADVLLHLGLQADLEQLHPMAE
ncbi:MAG TPA: gluconeogenesis factor YvcK family protein [Terriglobales bacterium]